MLYTMLGLRFNRSNGFQHGPNEAEKQLVRSRDGSPWTIGKMELSSIASRLGLSASAG